MTKRNRSSSQHSRTGSAAQTDAASPSRTTATRGETPSRDLTVVPKPPPAPTREQPGTVGPSTVTQLGTGPRKTKRDVLQLRATPSGVDARSLNRARAERAADLSDAVLAGRGGLVHRSRGHPYQRFTPGKLGEPGHFSLAGDQFKDVMLANQNVSKDPDCYYQTITFHDRYQQLRMRGDSEERALLLAQGYANKRENILRTQEAYARSSLTAESRRAIKQSLLTGTIGDYGGENLTGLKAAVEGNPAQPEQLSRMRDAGVKREQSVLIAMMRGGMPSHGSGLLIRPNVIVTCAHNLEGNDGPPTIVINNKRYEVQSSTIHPQRESEKDGEKVTSLDHDLAVIKLKQPVPGARNVDFGAIDANGGRLQLLGYPSFASALVDVAYQEPEAELDALETNLSALGYADASNARRLWDKVMVRVHAALNAFDPDLTQVLEGTAWRETLPDANTSLKDLLSTAFDKMMEELNYAKIGYDAIDRHVATVKKVVISAAYMVAADDMRASGTNTAMLFQSQQADRPAIADGDRSFDHKMDAVDGNSGSPVFQGDRLVGVHVRGGTKGNTAMYLGGEHGTWLRQQLQ